MNNKALTPSSASGVIGLFAKPPVAGRVKTRLTSMLRPEDAARLARAFIIDSWASLAEVPDAARALVVTAPLPEGLVDAECVWLQGDGDLGARLERIARKGLEDHAWFMAVGADSPGLPMARFEDARAALRTHDAVLGPSEDGGFYLLGLRRCPEGLLAELPWSSEETCARTHAQLEDRGLSVASIEPWFDVDRPEDLQRLDGLLRAGHVSAPETATTLNALAREGRWSARS